MKNNSENNAVRFHLKTKYKNVEYVDIDTPEGMELSAKHGIRGLPTMVREDGKVLVGSDMTKVKVI